VRLGLTRGSSLAVTFGRVTFVGCQFEGAYIVINK
jgi:hypothetical protein